MTDDALRAQYDAFPYPARNPADEARRLVTGSPSHPVEIDHHLHAGTRDWSRPLRALIAGGGTGDALIQLAQILTTARHPYEITYLDLSRSAREIAEARARARSLAGIRFVTGSLLDAAALGPFDYVDCCGVLHHLPDPGAGLAALAGALAPGGGLGFMVYAPHGRTGVYPLQEAFQALFGHLSPEARLAAARATFDRVPEGHPFRRNPHVGDHEDGDAGFYDQLLHSRDVALDVGRWCAMLDAAGLELASMTAPVLYDLTRLAPGISLEGWAAMQAAEKLNGTIRKHVGYAHRKGEGRAPAGPSSLAMVPHLNVPVGPFAKAVAAGKGVPATVQGVTATIALPKAAAPLVARVNGRRTLAEIAAAAGTDPVAFAAIWGKAHDALTHVGALTYSRLYRG
ncbi:MAG: class I SAM-dependent methyltransferase [Shimia sp.]